MNENTISYKLDRIKNATDRMRTRTGVVSGVIEDVATAVEGMSVINNQNKTITTNGTYNADEGYTGLGTVNVNIPDGGYKGQLPLNSTISKTVCIGNELRIYLNTDSLANGTRVYYKENNIPTLDDSYIDIPTNASYGVIPNININSTYGLRASAYIIYDNDKKAFNNAQSLGSKSIKLTTTFNSEGAILVDIPVEDQGKTINALCYSEYSKKVYLFINAHLYKLDTQVEAPTWERIGTEYTFTAQDAKLSPTSAGIFLSDVQSSGNLLLYKEDTNTFIDTAINRKYRINELSNGDIITEYLYDDYYAEYKKFDKNLNTFSNLVNYRAYTGNKYSKTIIDGPNGIYISLLYSDGTNYLPTRVLKYNNDTGAYDLIGTFPKPASTQISEWKFLSKVIPIIGGYLYIDSNYNLWKLVNGEFISIGGFKVYDGRLVQDTDRPDFIYAVGSPDSATGNYIYQINIDTVQLKALYTLSGYYNMYRTITYYDNKILSVSNSSSYGSPAYYDINTDTWYNTGLNSKGASDNFAKYKVIDGKCYGFGSYVYKYNKVDNDFTINTLGTISKNTNYTPSINTIKNGNKVYIYDGSADAKNTKIGIWVLDITTDSLVQITETPYNKAVIRNNKIYFLASTSNVGQFIVDLSNDSYITSTHSGGDKYFDGLSSYNETAGYSLHNKARMSSYIDSELKKITSFDKELLDYSTSTKTFSIYNYQAFSLKYVGYCLCDADITELIICFTES